MAKSSIRNEETKFAFTLRTIVLSVLSTVSVCCAGGYTVGYYKAKIESEITFLKLNQEHQSEIALIKEKENQLRLEVASLKNNSVENISSIIKLIMSNEEKDN